MFFLHLKDKIGLERAVASSLISGNTLDRQLQKDFIDHSSKADLLEESFFMVAPKASWQDFTKHKEESHTHKHIERFRALVLVNDFTQLKQEFKGLKHTFKLYTSSIDTMHQLEIKQAQHLQKLIQDTLKALQLKLRAFWLILIPGLILFLFFNYRIYKDKEFN